MAPPSKDSRIRLLEPLATEFAAFRAAFGGGNTEIGMLRDAVRAFILSRTKRDKELRIRYEAELGRLNAAKRQPLRLVTKKVESD
jgi:hypothetical protein